MDTLSLIKGAKIYNGEKTISLIRMKLKHFLIPHRKINSKWVKYLNVRPETIKLLEENVGKTLSDINHSRILYDPTPIMLEIKAKGKQMGPN